MSESWVPAAIFLIFSALTYGILTLTLSVLQPQGIAAMLGMASTESSDDINPGSAGDYRATRIVVTTVRSGSFIAMVLSAYYGAVKIFNVESEALLMIGVAFFVLLFVIAMRIGVNRVAGLCYEDVKIWLGPIIWPSRFIGRRLRLNRVANYRIDVESSGDNGDEPVENVLNVLQNLASKDLRAKDFMLRISETVAVHAETPLEDVADMMDKLQIDAVVVYDKTVDQVLGIIDKAETLQGLRASDDDEPVCRDWCSASIFPVPITQQVATLFDDFRDRMDQTAVMLDESGKVAGILTFSNLMDQLLSDASLLSESSES